MTRPRDRGGGMGFKRPVAPDQGESAARGYLLAFCWKDEERFCPRCQARKLYRLADERVRCGQCGYTFHDFSGRWINQNNLTPAQWLQLLDLFENETSTRDISHQLTISYNTAYKAVMTVRKAIMAHYHNPRPPLPEASGPNAGPAAPLAAVAAPAPRHSLIAVFGILERDGHVWIRSLPNLDASDVMSMDVRKVRWASVVYTDRIMDYDALMFCGYQNLPRQEPERFWRGRVALDLAGGFWSFARERLTRHHGVSVEQFPLYLKELEFRYNHRNQDIFPILAAYVCHFVPDL